MSRAPWQNSNVDRAVDRAFLAALSLPARSVRSEVHDPVPARHRGAGQPTREIAMNKKQLTALVDGIVDRVANLNPASPLTDSEARTVVGLAIKKLTDSIVAATGVEAPVAS